MEVCGIKLFELGSVFRVHLSQNFISHAQVAAIKADAIAWPFV